jgi:sterol desaturase/sphingolipid hydroxylase (fatty acid hydroxylase superfamily)
VERSDSPLSYLWYPLVLSGAIVLFGVMHAAGAPLLAAMYTPIVVAALTVVGLELWDPERSDWRPRWPDVKADAAFMAVVQVAIPRVLSPLAVLAAAHITHDPSGAAWPHAWPLAAQALLMVLAVDFLRYWLHRACHTFAPLWRLHEVHHSPDLLYTLNVARFHPLEKVLHFCLDTVPFVLLGVAPEVIGAYFLLYAVNGFFQHSNVRLRYGVLNYLVGSAETHRWHHARDPGTAYCNFGNTTIVWDLLFGTWRLPRRRALDVGIPDRDYPKAFTRQMLAPFAPRKGRKRGMIASIGHALIALQLTLTSLLWRRRVAAGAADPMRQQRALLARILQANADTVFGREHGFERMRSERDFQQHVPVREYEALRSYVDREIERGEAALTAEPPIRYLRTSGTTGQPKDIPLTAKHQRALRRLHRAAVAAQRRLYPSAFDGGILAITSPCDEGVLRNGKPFGSASGVVAASTPHLVQDKFVVPPAVFGIADSRVKYLLILRLALARRDITWLGTANASTLLALMQLFREHHAQLLADLRSGGFSLAHRVPHNLLETLDSRLAPAPMRADEIASLVTSGRMVRIADLWPELRLVVSWTCASAGLAAAALRAELSPGTVIHELGYLSSEFRGTITIGRRSGSGLPTFDTHYFEFVERERWDRGEPEFLTLDQVRKGVDYYIIVTTPSGLYRYFINDLVRVTGFLRRAPLLKFLQKGKGVTSITGEKLYESQVLAAVRNVIAGTGRTARFVMMLADEHARGYRLYVEADPGPKPPASTLAQAVDAQLQSLNLEYRAKRESARLARLWAAWLVPGTEDAFKRYSVAQGQREGQFKVIALAYRAKLGFDLDAHLERSET